jgi:hypothetical protein
MAPSLARCLVSLPIEVVLPAPLTPATMITVGWCTPMTSAFSSGAAVSVRASASRPLTCGRVGGAAVLDAALEVVEQMLRGLDAGVGHQQGRFQFLVQRVVNARAGEHGGNAGAGLAQARAELVQPACALGWRVTRPSAGLKAPCAVWGWCRAAPLTRLAPWRTHRVQRGLAGWQALGGFFSGRKLNIWGLLRITPFYETPPADAS